jgi:predicted glycogen debranching enzyme
MSSSAEAPSAPKAVELKRALTAEDLQEARAGISTEWLLTNGVGGYSSSTVSGRLARRYHGVLVAALPAPLGRVVMVTAIGERVRLPDSRVEWLTSGDLAGERIDPGSLLTDFSLESGLPHWQYRFACGVLHKRVFLVYGQNTVLVLYTFEGEGPLRLGLRPFLSPRAHDAPVSMEVTHPQEAVLYPNGVELRFESPLPALQLKCSGVRTAFTAEPAYAPTVAYSMERDRGYEYEGALWSPGYFRANLANGDSTSLLMSTEGWSAASELGPEEIQRAEHERRAHLYSLAGSSADDPIQAELVLAADQFVVSPSWRTRDVARSRAGGVEARSVVAGYYWFTDWGRDTMISLEGLTLSTGRAPEARAILLNFAQHIRNGLIPNLFPEGEQSGLYHTADATLWMFHAVNRYVQVTNDQSILERLLPALQDCLRHHIAGTLFHIHMDPADGLLSQGEQGYQLTWMDAKVGDWVVTPRRGKAVEINALWHNALRLTSQWTEQLQGPEAAREYADLAQRACESFNERFWFADGNYLYDIVDGEAGDDPALRPNQVLAISLEYPILRRDRWTRVMDVVKEHLLTPVGLRSLAPAHPDFKTQYYGDLRSRDAAYHQGTVWAWLIGPYLDAWLKVHPEGRDEARTILSGLVAHLGDAGLGTLSEVFDAMPPYTPRGCIAQAWSVAEVLRLWTALK